ncbi:MAG: RNA polymerase sigma factor [Gemmatimonadetes bacterium]|nr:RNA polymerase sigma factor [Gemmatimonadota bacterium]
MADRDEAFYLEFLAPLEEQMSRTVWRIVRDREMARDAVQDAVTLLWRRRDRVRAHPNPRALVLRVCMNAAVDALRRSRKEMERMQVELPATLTSGPGSQPGAGLEADEIAGRVRSALARLPSRQATAVLLRVLEDRSYEEIATAMGCSAVTARIHVMRGRARLGSLLAPLAGPMGAST